MLIGELSKEDLEGELIDVIGSSVAPTFALDGDIDGRLDEVASELENLSEEEAPDSRTISKLVSTIEDVKNDYKDMVLNAFESAMKTAGRYYPEISPGFEDWVHKKSVLGVTSSTLNVVLNSFRFADLKTVLPIFFENRNTLNGGTFEDLTKTMFSFSRRGYGIHKDVPFSDWVNLIENTLYRKDEDLFRKQTNSPSVFLSFGIKSVKDFDSAMGLFVKIWPNKESLSSFQESTIKKTVMGWFQQNNPKIIEERLDALKKLDLEPFILKSPAVNVIKEAFVEAVNKVGTPEQKSDFEKFLLSRRSSPSARSPNPSALKKLPNSVEFVL
jgi:hypothetical protein